MTFDKGASGMPDFTEIPPERKPPRGTEETDFPVPAQVPPLYRGSGHERLMTILTAGIVAAFMSVIVVYGLHTINRTAIWAETLTQQGMATVPRNETMDVYYHVPYQSPPNVQITGPSAEEVLIVEQTTDHFKVKNKDNAKPCTFNWRTEGLPAK
jgi:hypothetical protein